MNRTVKAPKHHRGNVSPLHNTVQNELVDILERKNRRVKKEYEVPSRVEAGKCWVVDVADITDAGNPVYYEVQDGQNASFTEKMLALANHNQIDLVPLYLSELRAALGDNPRLADLRAWIEKAVI